MLKYHQQIWDKMEAHPSMLVISGKGMDMFEIVKQLAVKYSLERKFVVIFGCNDAEKHKIIWECANSGVEFLPKDIEKDTLKDERNQNYNAHNVIFHNGGVLARDFLQSVLNPTQVEGFIINNAEVIFKDPGLQLALSIYKSKHTGGFVKAFSERPYLMSDINKVTDLLWVRFILLYPRFEDSVKESISDSEVQIISIQLKSKKVQELKTKEDGFKPIVIKELSNVFEILHSLHTQFVAEYSRTLGIKYIDSITLPRSSLLARADTDEKVEAVSSLLFLRTAKFSLLHDSPQTFYEFIESRKPNPLHQPLWAMYPQANPFFTAARKYYQTDIPSPKLQWISHLMATLPNDKKILLLAEGSSTVDTICNYLASFVPETGSKKVTGPLHITESYDEEPLIDPTIFGVLTPPLVLLQEIHAQSDIFQSFEPDFVIFYDVNLLALRRLELYSSRSGRKIKAYVLEYTEADEFASLQGSAENENQTFMRIIERVPSTALLPLVPFVESGRSIITDSREFRSFMPLALLRVGFKLVPSMIIVGDYVLSDDVVVERKAYTDLVGSLKDGRLLSQIQRMQTFYKRSILLLEFSESEPFNSVGKNFPVMAKVAAITKHFPQLRIVWGANALECAKSLMAIAKLEPPPNIERAVGMGAGSSERGSRAGFLSAASFLTADQVSRVAARAKNLRQLLSISREEMMKILPPSVAFKLYALLHSSPKRKSEI